MSFEQWWEIRKDFYEVSDEASLYSAAMDGWEARQKEVDSILHTNQVQAGIIQELRYEIENQKQNHFHNSRPG